MTNLGTGVYHGPGPILVHLRKCSIDTLPLLIRAKCAYHEDSGAMVTGFQVIAHPTYIDQLAIGKLYANHTMEFQTSAIVEVEQNGVFLVSVIPVLGETGIVNSSVEYSEVVVMEDLLTATSTGWLQLHVTVGIVSLHNIIIGNIADTESRKDIFFGNRKY